MAGRGIVGRGIAGGTGPANLKGDAAGQAAPNGQSLLDSACSSETPPAVVVSDKALGWGPAGVISSHNPPIVPSLHPLEPPWINLLSLIGACGPRE